MYHLGVLIPYNLLFNAKPEVRSPKPDPKSRPDTRTFKRESRQAREMLFNLPYHPIKEFIFIKLFTICIFFEIIPLLLNK